MHRELKIQKNKREAKHRILLKDRFNKPVEESDFLNIFQEIMLDRMILNQTKKYNRINVNRIIDKHTGRNPKSFNLDIKDGLLLTCSVNPEIYLLIQETAKKLFGKYVPMDELIHELLCWFICYYNAKNTSRISLPYIKKQRKITNLRKFERRFKKYFKNTCTLKK